MYNLISIDHNNLPKAIHSAMYILYQLTN